VLRNFGTDYVGLDYSSEMIELCTKAFQDTRFVHGDVRKMDMFGEEEFDFVLFSYNGLDTMSHEGRLQGLKEIRRILRQDGIFAFSSLNRKFHGAISYPKIQLTSDIGKLVGNLLVFPVSWLNFYKNKKRQYFGSEYSIVVIQDNNYRFLAYQIDKKHQVLQLDQLGFEVVDMYDTFGRTVALNTDDADSPWIYYVLGKKLKTG
jgi:ubiquinone/menaquinone biosynthesis C-methylase UbiE